MPCFAILYFCIRFGKISVLFPHRLDYKDKLCLSMGVKQSSDIAQEIMEQVLSDLDELEIQIDDVACFP